MQKHLVGLRQAKKYIDLKGLRLHLGCGSNIKTGWVNIDLDENADLTLDLREPLTISDNSCSIVYSEHFLEHLDYPEKANMLLRECFRILEPNGIVSIGVPDTEWPMLEYSGLRNDGYFEIAKEKWHPKCETEIEHVNHHFRGGTKTLHRFAYDFKTLKHILELNGFVEIVRRSFGRHLDLKHRELGTLYVSAHKPSL